LTLLLPLQLFTEPGQFTDSPLLLVGLLGTLPNVDEVSSELEENAACAMQLPIGRVIFSILGLTLPVQLQPPLSLKHIKLHSLPEQLVIADNVFVTCTLTGTLQASLPQHSQLNVGAVLWLIKVLLIAFKSGHSPIVVLTGEVLPRIPPHR